MGARIEHQPMLVRTCDFCGMAETRRLGEEVFNCDICEKDFCGKHGHFYEWPGHRNEETRARRFCDECWGATKTLRAEIEAEHDRHNAELERIDLAVDAIAVAAKKRPTTPPTATPDSPRTHPPPAGT